MIVVTGGAGFIGSALVWALNKQGRRDIIVVDHLDESEKWKNLVGLKYAEYIDRDQFILNLEAGLFGNSIDVLVHLGACSSTMETDSGYLIENNYRYTLRIARWREKHRSTRLLYASSAATYGDGELGYCDDHASLGTLRPLNMYAYSKHLFDCHAADAGWLSEIVGLKFFNVFGPNEYHKKGMRSVMCKTFSQVAQEGTMHLFKSYADGIAHGDQKRDFVYVKDAVAMVLFFIDSPQVNGIFNIGTGKARSWNDVANAMFAALGKKTDIQYIDMPEALRGKYQYFTQADCTKINAAGCAHVCMSLEDSIKDYITGYLQTGALLA